MAPVYYRVCLQSQCNIRNKQYYLRRELAGVVGPDTGSIVGVGVVAEIYLGPRGTRRCR